MRSPPPSLSLPEPLLQQVLGRSIRAVPHEACGLFLGRIGPTSVEVVATVALANHSAEPDAFRIDGIELLEAEDRAAGQGLEVVGTYHSHPNASADPSVRDRQAARLWPHTVWLIVGMGAAAAPESRPWWSAAGDLQPMPWAGPVLSSAVP